MKELSIEEKAKAYDEAIDKIKYVMEHGVSPTLNKEDLQDIFPELAESEDERIRYALISQFKDYQRRGENHGFGYSNKDILAWLEKKGKQEWTDEDKPYFRKISLILSKELPADEFHDVMIWFEHLKSTDEEPDILNGAALDNNEDGLIADTIKVKNEQKIEWSEEDERDFDTVYGIIYNSCNAEDASRLIEWLKSLKDRVQPKPNQEEWSEEDIAIISRVISIVKWAAYSDHSHPILNDEGATELIDWLKSIRPQSKWSPSDEQMKALWNSIPENVMEISEREMLLDSLYQDLKKLL